MESKESITLGRLAIDIEFEKQCIYINRSQDTWDFKK